MDLFWDTLFLKKDASMDQHEWFSIDFGVRQGSPQGVQRTMFSGSENTLGTKWPQEPPKGPPRLPKAPKITRKHRFSSIFVWCSDVICHIILARDSLAAFQASQDKTKIAIVAPSFHSIRLHISQGEYPNPPSTCERKRNSASYVQARWRGWPAGQLDIYIYIYMAVSY